MSEHIPPMREQKNEAPEVGAAFSRSERGREASAFADSELHILAERGVGVAERSPERAGKARSIAQRFALATMIAASLNGVLAEQAEAGSRRGGRVATGVSVGAQVLEDIWAAKAEQHAEMARDLDKMERRFKLLTQQVDAIHDRLGTLRDAVKDPSIGRWRRSSIQREIDGLTRKQAAYLAELEELAEILDSVNTDSKKEAEKARKDAMKADIARTIGSVADDMRRGW